MTPEEIAAANREIREALTPTVTPDKPFTGWDLDKARASLYGAQQDGQERA